MDPVLRAIFLDFDGTLVDTMHTFAKVVNEQLREYGVNNVNEDTVGKQILGIFDDKPMGGGKRMVPRLLYSIGRIAGLGRLNSLRFSRSSIGRLKNTYLISDLFPDVIPSLKTLRDKGFKLAIVSMASKSNIELILSRFPELADLIEVVVSRDDVKVTKPNPQCLILALNMLGGNIKDSKDHFVIGDLPLDIEAGLAAGMRVVGVTSGIADTHILQRYGPEKIVSSLSEATQWILSQESKNQ